MAGISSVAAVIAASSCPPSYPWAYRPADGLDYCCATADDKSYHGANSIANLSLRSDSCRNNNYMQCASAPCTDFWAGDYQQGADVTLQDDRVRIVVNTDANNGAMFGTLTSLSQNTAAPSLIASSPATSWSASFVVEGGTEAISVDSSSESTRSVVSSSATSLKLKWSLTIAGSEGVDVTLDLSLVDGSLEHRLTFESDSDKLGLWDWALLPASGLLQPEGASNFENKGFGVMHNPPSSFSGTYPQQTMQYMAAFGPSGSNYSNVYVAALDVDASSKHFRCSSNGNQAVYSISATPPGAGLPMAGRVYTNEYPIVVSLFDGDWWDAASIYRKWALGEASWTKQGPMSERSDVPSWLYGLTTWVNSHWQGTDIFDLTGGDPAVVRNRISSINDRFGLGRDRLALHWYEWDTLGYELGSNYSNCASEVTCGFDTHYPEYFPVREGFNESLAAMQALGVRVAPYINGRIFDKSTDTWKNDNAESFAAKQAKPEVGTPDLSTYEEQYGSKAKFAVMCPHTAYWQDTLADTVGELTNSFGTDGVYIDQIAAAGPKDCFDPTHNHTIGGGHHWVDGYRAMLEKVRAMAGNDKIVLTESNAEPFMSGINLFLTLVGFRDGDIPSTPMPVSKSIMVPAFMAVYGGYVLPVGAEFFAADFTNPDVFAAKVAVQYVFGAQLGWFSLGPGSDGMGIFDTLMHSDYDEEVHYLKLLSDAKIVAAEWFNHGRTMRPLELTLEDAGSLTAMPEHPRSSKERDRVGLSFGSVLSSAWLSADDSSLLITVTTVKRDTPAKISAMVDLSQYGFPHAAGQKFCIWSMPAEEKLGTYSGDAVQLDLSLAARDVAVLRVQLDNDEEWV